MCVSNIHAIVWTIFMFENSIGMLPCAILSFNPQDDVNKHQRQKIPAMFCIKFTSPTNHL